jgi:hypothetical protein
MNRCKVNSPGWVLFQPSWMIQLIQVKRNMIVCAVAKWLAGVIIGPSYLQRRQRRALFFIFPHLLPCRRWHAFPMSRTRIRTRSCLRLYPLSLLRRKLVTFRSSPSRHASLYVFFYQGTRTWGVQPASSYNYPSRPFHTHLRHDNMVRIGIYSKRTYIVWIVKTLLLLCHCWR